jgi:hypothetical protein
MTPSLQLTDSVGPWFRRGSVSRIGGMSLQDLQRETESFWAKGFPEKAMTKLEDYGFIQSRAKVRTEGWEHKGMGGAGVTKRHHRGLCMCILGGLTRKPFQSRAKAGTEVVLGEWLCGHLGPLVGNHWLHELCFVTTKQPRVGIADPLNG